MRAFQMGEQLKIITSYSMVALTICNIQCLISAHKGLQVGSKAVGEQ